MSNFLYGLISIIMVGIILWTIYKNIIIPSAKEEEKLKLKQGEKKWKYPKK